MKYALPVLCFTLLSSMWVLAWQRAEFHLDAGRHLEEQGELSRSLYRYQWSMRSYSPWATAPHQAAEALWRLGIEAESRGEHMLALRAFDLLRGGVWSTQWLHSPFEHWRQPTDHKIAVLRAKEEQRVREDWRARSLKGSPYSLTQSVLDYTREESPSLDRLIAQHQADLNFDPRPSSCRSATLSFSLFAWIICLIGWIRFGLDENAQRTAHTSKWIIGVVLSSILWMGILY